MTAKSASWVHLVTVALFIDNIILLIRLNAVLRAEYGHKAGVPSMLKQVRDDGMIMTLMIEPDIQRVQALADIWRSALCCVIAAKAVHRLQIRPKVHN